MIACKALQSQSARTEPKKVILLPWVNLQRDGHMRMRVATGRVSYEPNTLAPEAPRAEPSRGFTGLTRAENGDTMRIRPESFADHYSQARMFFLSQTEAEKNHIVEHWSLS